MAFKFRLSALLKLREAARDERRRQLSQAQLAIEKLTSEQQEIARSQLALQATRRTQSSGAVQVDRLIAAQRYEAVLQSSAQAITKQMEVIQQEVQRRRQALVESDRAVRILEKLRDTQQQRWQQEATRADVKQMDEVAARFIDGEQW